MPDNKNPRPGHASTGAKTMLNSGVGYEAGSGGSPRIESRGSRAFREWEAKYNASLLNEQPTRKGGGKSGGGGGGKWGIVNRVLGRRSPWSLLRNDKSY